MCDDALILIKWGSCVKNAGALCQAKKMAADRKGKGKRVLCVGLICLDIVNVCDYFPREDEDIRALEHRWQRGGNAANQAEMLSQLGMDVEFLGSLSDSQASDFAVKTLTTRGIKTSNCIIHKGIGFPTSCVTLSQKTGSRTIVHFRPKEFPEVSNENFVKLDLELYGWIHFEVRRSFKETLEMIAVVDAFNETRIDDDKIVISIELEKKHEDSIKLLHSADFVIISKDLAQFLGFDSASTAVKELYPKVKPGGSLICPWGSSGADTMGPKGGLVHSDAYPPEQIKDSLGAGDTFIAGVIKSLSDGNSLQKSLTLGCELAGYKCGIDGYDKLSDYWNNVLTAQSATSMQSKIIAESH